MARNTADLDALVGRTLGRRRYEVVARIAQGGMAIVYRGHDRQLDRVVAIKVPRTEFARDRGFSEQFRREARTAARLSHPNVVAVYDSGEERGLPWIVMEHVSGRTLRDLLDSQRRLSPETTAELLGPVADALDHAHHAGVVHLDVKPENLLLTSETVKVADFGLVRAAAQRGHGQALAATVHYCAPEVLRGGVVDGRADVYALGVVAWECVSGRPPFEGDARQVVAQHLGGRVPPPSRGVAGIPEPFDAAVARATDPDPTLRFLRASDFAAAIGAPRRRRVDETLRATTLLAPAGPDTTAGWAPAAGAAGAAPGGPSAPTTGLPVEGRGAATQGWGGQAPPTQSLNGWAAETGRGGPPPAGLRPRPTTGRVPKTRARRKGGKGRLLAALLVVALLAVGLLTRAGGLLGGSVRVPEVVGLEVAEATQDLRSRGLDVKV
ncbi:MAG TPA: protein kinase, partial [Actinomycetota bacterium]|nr:protein kinase [Actinomycetota bacterium]